MNLYWQPADGSAEAELLLARDRAQFPMGWSPDGKVLAFIETEESTDVFLYTIDREDAPIPFLNSTVFQEHTPRFSPNGRYIAYICDESGQWEVYVRAYPGPGGKRAISTKGGTEPVWSPDGRELFYRRGDALMVVDITTDPGFRAGTPRILFEGAYDFHPARTQDYDVSPYGQRFVMIRRARESAPTQINVILDWFDELRRHAPSN
jgi:Tol biopolymer transport system component